ncbi:MAG: hypothetical protein KGL67_03345 [Patescibacteria group bacterium]|nr:hypothetical protein [Patescibacteria group bacterium]
MDRKKLIKTLSFLTVTLFLVNSLANKFYWYSAIWYFDMIMHTLGGICLGLASVYFFPPKDSSLKSLLKILLFVFVVGVGWEVFEIIFYNIIAQTPFNALDTISDVFFDLAGGGLAVLYFLKNYISIEK